MKDVNESESLGSTRASGGDPKYNISDPKDLT